MITRPTLPNELLNEADKAGAALADDTLFLPDIDTLITEDDEPVDNVFSAKQQRFLVETLYANVALWNPEAVPFIAVHRFMKCNGTTVVVRQQCLRLG
jgi:hypothetical protein